MSLSPFAIRELEPAVRGIGGILIPEVAVIDQDAFVNSLYEKARSISVHFVFNCPITQVKRATDGWSLIINGSSLINTDFVINAAGPGANQIAGQMGRPHTVRYLRGEYFRVVKTENINPGLLFKHLIYPIPRKGEGGLGIHLTPTLNGDLLVGPNAVSVESPYDLGQYVKHQSPEFFRRRVKKMWPGMELVELEKHFAGIRCQSETGDFVFDTGTDYVHVIGYESPGLTASLASAKYICDLIAEQIRTFH